MNTLHAPSITLPRLFLTGLGALLVFLLIFGAGKAVADPRVNVIWVDATSGETFEVISPTAAPLGAVKRRVMAEIGLIPGRSGDFQVEQIVETESTLPSRDPQSGQTVFQTVSEPVVLDEDLTLRELGIVAGDTLTLTRIAGQDRPHPGQGRGR